MTIEVPISLEVEAKLRERAAKFFEQLVLSTTVEEILAKRKQEEETD